MRNGDVKHRQIGRVSVGWLSFYHLIDALGIKGYKAISDMAIGDVATGFSRLKPALIRPAILVFVVGVLISPAQAQDPLSRFLDEIFKPELTMPLQASYPEPEIVLPVEDVQPSPAAALPEEMTSVAPPMPPVRPYTLLRTANPSSFEPDNASRNEDPAQSVATDAEQLTIAIPVPPLPPVRPSGIGQIVSASIVPSVVMQGEGSEAELSRTQIAAPAQPSAPQIAQVNPMPRNASEAVARVNAYLNEINTLTARFLQSGADHRQVGGTLYVQRPGRMRFAYDPPSTLEIVADGRSVAVRDAKLRTNDVYSIGQTPLKFLLRDNVNLSRDVKVRDVNIDPRGSIELTLEDSATLGGTSTVTLRFDARANVLRGWIILDPQGYETTVTLSDVQVVKR